MRSSHIYSWAAIKHFFYLQTYLFDFLLNDILQRDGA